MVDTIRHMCFLVFQDMKCSYNLGLFETDIGENSTPYSEIFHWKINWGNSGKMSTLSRIGSGSNWEYCKKLNGEVNDKAVQRWPL